MSDPIAITIPSLIEEVEASYNHNVAQAKKYANQGARVKNRVYWGRALECAAMLVSHYRRLDLYEEMMLWEDRRRLCERLAYNHQRPTNDSEN